MTSRRTPDWLPWAGGVWVFSYLGGGQATDGGHSMIWIAAHQALLFGYLWWDHRRAPSPRGRAPHEYRVYYVVLGLLALALVVVGLPLFVVVGGWSGAALVGVAAVGFGLLADRTYARITRTVKERLA